jgi:hypothetical protein
MRWEISANLGVHARANIDVRGWLWEITRGAQVARVVIEISEAAWSSDPLRAYPGWAVCRSIALDFSAAIESEA